MDKLPEDPDADTLVGSERMGAPVRHILVGFKFVGLATVLTIQMVWKAINKKRERQQ